MKKRTRRHFLEAVGGGVPTLSRVSGGGRAAALQVAGSGGVSGKFTPLDLGGVFNAGPADLGPRAKARALTGPSAQDGLIHVPAGEQRFRGIPFRLGREGAREKSWLWLSTRGGIAAGSAEIDLKRTARFIVFAQFCDWDVSEQSGSDPEMVESLGQKLAEAVLVYTDGREAAFPIRRRFEVNSPSIAWGFPGYACVSHHQDGARRSRNEIDELGEWGWFRLQGEVLEGNYPLDARTGAPKPSLWLFALPNPHAEQNIAALRLRSASEDALVVCGITLFHGKQNPLRYGRLTRYQLTLPDQSLEWVADVDLGVIARSYQMGKFAPQEWLAAPDAGLGSRRPPESGQHLCLEITASPDATLVVRDKRSGRQFTFELEKLQDGNQMAGTPAGARIEVLGREKTWLHGKVTDSATGKPTPVRLSFLSPDGRYIAPCGHRTEIETGAFKDWGADVKLMDSSYAYVDGTFQIELPVGEVYVEIAKGFEYAPVRRQLTIHAGQRELNLEVARALDFRSQGWVSADTHVHFLSPSTAVLEGQAEDLNIVNLLAAQWGDLYTNVGDLGQGRLASADGETQVWMGTENRQHILGHLSALGAPVFPMSAGGPRESYHGDPVWETLADWADACRERGGLTVSPHFPYPVGEGVADIVLGKIDAVELFPGRSWGFDDNVHLRHWYRSLNCGYRVPVVGGTDKMDARTAVGASRTYVRLGDESVTQAAWTRAVRSGNTFMTGGPLLLLEAEGRVPGGEIRMGPGGGAIEVVAQALSTVPVHLLEIVWNGRVVASRERAEGSRDITLKERLPVPGPGWLAARCASRLRPRLIAHTSPVYVVTPGRDVFSETAAAFMLTQIDAARTWAETLATRPDPERFERVLKVFSDARNLLERRLAEFKKSGPG